MNHPFPAPATTTLYRAEFQQQLTAAKASGAVLELNLETAADRELLIALGRLLGEAHSRYVDRGWRRCVAATTVAASGVETLWRSLMAAQGGG